MNINKFKFRPVNQYSKGGNEIQVCDTKYKNIIITWITYFPYNVFKEPTDTFIVDWIIPITNTVINGEVSDAYYTDEGFGLPVFKKLEDAVNYIDTVR